MGLGWWGTSHSVPSPVGTGLWAPWSSSFDFSVLKVWVTGVFSVDAPLPSSCKYAIVTFSAWETLCFWLQISPSLIFSSSSFGFMGMQTLFSYIGCNFILFLGGVPCVSFLSVSLAWFFGCSLRCWFSVSLETPVAFLVCIVRDEYLVFTQSSTDAFFLSSLNFLRIAFLFK